METVTSDQQLVEQMRAGEERAYQTLLDRFERPIYRFFYYSVTQKDLACDMCGETFSEFVGALYRGKLREPSHLTAFVWGIARNVLLRHRRRSRLVCIAIGSEVVSNKPTVVQQVVARDELSRAMTAINGFKEPERQVMLLRFVEQLPLREIATILHIPINSVKSYVHRARKQLVAALSDKQHDPQETHHGH